MDSLWQALGRSFNALVSGKTPRKEKVACASGQRGSAVEGVGVGSEGVGASQCSEPRVRKKMRYLVEERLALGSDACAFRDSYYEERGKCMDGFRLSFGIVSISKVPGNRRLLS